MIFDTPYGKSENDLTEEEYELAKILDRYFGMNRPYGDRKAAASFTNWIGMSDATQWLARRLIIHYGWKFIVYRESDSKLKILWDELDSIPQLIFEKSNWQFKRLIEHGII